jgi:hypothetical protein
MYYIGTSGWSYNNWKGIFYPKDVKSTKWLMYYSKYFKTVEVNNSFYALPKKEILKRWSEYTPEEFIFSVKVWNVITHKKKLLNCEEPLNLFLKNVSSLENKLGVILFQLPPNLKKNLPLLKNFLKLLPSGFRYAFEFRSTDWHTEEICNILHENNIAFCIFEMCDFITPLFVSADFIYIRLHGRQGKYRGNYDDSTLEGFRDWFDIKNIDSYAYFDNTDDEDNAIRNAIKLNSLVLE